MLWKELHTGGAQGFARFVGWLLTLILGGLLLYYGAWCGLMAFLEVWDHGYGIRGGAGSGPTTARWEFLYFLDVSCR